MIKLDIYDLIDLYLPSYYLSHLSEYIRIGKVQNLCEMKKYQIKTIITEQLNTIEYDKTVPALAKLIKVTRKHFWNVMLEYEMRDKGCISTDQLFLIVNYLIANYPKKFHSLTIAQLVNEPIKIQKLREKAKKKLAA